MGQEQSTVKVLFSANVCVCVHVHGYAISIVQLLLSAGSTQPLDFQQKLLDRQNCP